MCVFKTSFPLSPYLKNRKLFVRDQNLIIFFLGSYTLYDSTFNVKSLICVFFFLCCCQSTCMYAVVCLEQQVYSSTESCVSCWFSLQKEETTQNISCITKLKCQPAYFESWWFMIKRCCEQQIEKCSNWHKHMLFHDAGRGVGCFLSYTKGTSKPCLCYDFCLLNFHPLCPFISQILEDTLSCLSI